jgi:putative ABC transport system substrate-binding protein
LGPKRIGLLHELVPKGTVIAVLVDQNFQDAASQLTRIQETARSLGREIVVLNVRTASDIDAAFATLAQQRAGALFCLGGNFFNTRREQIIGLAARYRIPAVSDAREFAADGGLLSYGNDGTESFHQAGIYTGRILRGAKPTDLPVMQPTKYELVINLKTAKALGLTIPPSLLATADEVIE